MTPWTQGRASLAPSRRAMRRGRHPWHRGAIAERVMKTLDYEDLAVAGRAVWEEPIAWTPPARALLSV
jgi:hypothetical protein